MLNKELRRRLFINRQPTLWRHGVPFVDVVPIEDNENFTIALNPLILEPLNGDFDGDTCALYTIHDNKALEEAVDKAYLKNDVYYDHSNSYLSLIRHEALYSVYLLSKDVNNINTDHIIKINELKDLPENIELYNKPDICIEFMSNYYSYGICLINKWCGFDKIIINEVINKKNNSYISECVYNYFQDGEIYYKNLNNLEKNLFFYVSICDYYPPTISLDEMLNFIDEKTDALINKIPNNIAVGYLVNDALVARCLNNLVKQDNTLLNLFKSGSRFSEKQLSRSCINIGFNADANNMVKPFAINTNLLKGLTEKEFFAGSSGTRKGIADKDKATPDSGYLERSMAMGLSVIEIAEEDCGTKSLLETEIISEKHKKTLINKWCKIEKNEDLFLLTEDNIKNIKVGDTIYLRSPIHCETKDRKICKKCWGEKNFKTKYIGILAGQILAERFTQLTMRSFHESGSAQLSLNKDLKLFVQNHLNNISYEEHYIILEFDVDVPDEINDLFNQFPNWQLNVQNKVYFYNTLNDAINNDPIQALKNVKDILKVSKFNISHPDKYYQMLMKQILTVGEPYSSFAESLLANMFLVDINNNRLWRYYKQENIICKLGDKTLANKTSPLLDLLYQQNDKTINRIELLDTYIDNNDNLTIYEKLFLEKF